MEDANQATLLEMHQVIKDILNVRSLESKLKQKEGEKKLRDIA